MAIIPTTSSIHSEPRSRRTKAPEIAREAIEMIRMVYVEEKQAREVPADERRWLRQGQSAPILAQIREKLLLRKGQLLPKHSMTEAINYALSQWQELDVFCYNGDVAIGRVENRRSGVSLPVAA